MGEWSKETTIADGYYYPLLLGLGAQRWAGLGWAGLGAGGLECSISAKTNPGAAAAAYYSITQPL